MAIEKVVTPYEFLARWRAGALTGAHVQFLTRIIEDGVVLSEALGDALPVDVGGGKGFPLAEIVSQIHVDALAAVDLATAEKTAALAEAEKAAEEKAAAIAQRDTALEEKAVLISQRDSVVAELLVLQGQIK